MLELRLPLNIDLFNRFIVIICDGMFHRKHAIAYMPQHIE